MQKADVLTSLIQKGKIFIFSGTYCPYCDIAKSTLKKLNIPFDYRELDINPLSSQDAKRLNNICGFESIPKIFVGLNCIGGNSDMQDLIKSGEFFEILKSEEIPY